MSLLGPDDFGLDRKSRTKKLAKDLSPSLQREIEKWLDNAEEPSALEKLSEIVGPEEAKRLMSRRLTSKKKKTENEDRLSED
jgi:hypothetical protein